MLQQPVNMITGYQRQNRKAINYIPTEGGDSSTTDQYTRIITQICNTESIYEQYSKACELACISGKVLIQPYLDYNGTDQAQGQLKLKVWEYNSFMVDPYYRNPDMSDAQWVWCQEYISKREAEARFPGKTEGITPMAGAPQRYGRFYFLPENYYMNRNDLLVLSYVWYKWRTKKKRLYSRSRNQFFDYAGGQEQLDLILYAIPDLEEVTVEVPSWKLAVILNDQLMYQGENPLGFTECPFVAVDWNYEPHNNYYDLRCRGLVRTMRDANYLLNRRIILNHDISEATINAGWKRKSGAVLNEDNLKKSGQGWDIIINENYELSDVEKIIPSAVPESDMALADQLQSLIFATSGINLESWTAQDSPNASSLTVFMKQAANLTVLQKYFDQWDLSLKYLGDRLLKIVLNNWNAQKVQLYLGEEPTAYFYSRIFSSFQCVVEQGLLTPTQRYQEYQQWLELNQQLGGLIPPQELAKRAPIQGKTELMALLQQQQQQQAAVQAEATNLQQAMEEAKLKEIMARTANSLASAKERYGRFESNVGLLEERISEISKNRALSTKAKMEALEKMVEVIGKYGEIETALKLADIQSYAYEDKMIEDQEKQQAHRESFANEFTSKLMGQGQMAM